MVIVHEPRLTKISKKLHNNEVKTLLINLQYVTCLRILKLSMIDYDQLPKTT